MGQKCAISVISALAASASLSQSKFAAADGPFTFSGFSTSPSASIPQQQGSTPPTSESGKEPSATGEESDARPRFRNDNPRTTSAGFDPEALERGAKALKGINNSAHAKKVFENIKTQEETRQAEFTAKAQEFKAMQSQAEAERQRVIYDEQKKLAQNQAQTKSQMASGEAKDPWKGEEWGMSENEKKTPSGVKMVTRGRKQMPRGLEEKYEAYFLPRKPWPKALAFYGSFILGGIGAGMLIEAWIDKKVKKDGGVIWEFDK